MSESELVQLSFHKIMQTRSYTVIILSAKEKSFAIYTDPIVGKNIQLFLTETKTPRPLTHSLVNMIFQGLNITVRQVVINDVQDTVYYTRLFLEQEVEDTRHIIETDARPSDSLMWALLANAPVYCTQDVLDKTIGIETETK